MGSAYGSNISAGASPWLVYPHIIWQIKISGGYEASRWIGDVVIRDLVEDIRRFWVSGWRSHTVN
jgi:hypothetical protein